MQVPSTTWRSLAAPAISAVLLLSACQHQVDPPGTGPDPVVQESPCDPATIYFVQDVLPLLVSSCAQSGCHDAASHADGIVLESFADLMEDGDLVVAGQPGESELIEVLFETGDDLMPPPPNAPLTDAQINVLTDWIAQGALNLSCTDCDTTAVTYSGSIGPLLSTTCTGCHSGTSPDGGVDLTNHGHVVDAVNNSNLMASIRQEAGASAMPPAGNALNDCQIQLFEIWIADGMPNN